MKITILFTSLLLLGSAVFAEIKGEKPFQVKVTLDGIKDSTIYLANYYGSKILKVDSIRLDHQGGGVFTKSTKRPEGIYVIYMNKDNYFDFLIGSDQTFSITTSFTSQAKRNFSGAVESEAFQSYQEFLSIQRAKQIRLQKEAEAHKNNKDSMIVITEDLTKLNHEMESYWDQKSKAYSGTFYSDFIRSMIFPTPPETSTADKSRSADSLRWVMRYNFMKDHYWDNFNFSQNALIRTPLIDSRLDNYFKNTLLQIPDSFLKPTVNLIEKSKANDEMYHYIALNRLNASLTSEVMGMDKVFVELAERYFLKSNSSWLDTAAIKKIKEKVRSTKPNLIGNLAPEIKLPDSEGNYYSLRQLNAKYTLLVFWEPNCSHCKKVIPQLNKDLYLPLKDKGIEVFAVCSQNKKEEWMKFVLENKLNDWTNVWDPALTSNFRINYDVYSTPVIYILDSTKHIIAKRLDVESSIKFLNHLLEKK
jgi:peroxiredoxin